MLALALGNQRELLAQSLCIACFQGQMRCFCMPAPSYSTVQDGTTRQYFNSQEPNHMYELSFQMRLQKISSRGTREAGLHSRPKTKGNRKSKGLPCSNSPTFCWCLPAAWGGWDPRTATSCHLCHCKAEHRAAWHKSLQKPWQCLSQMKPSLGTGLMPCLW